MLEYQPYTYLVGRSALDHWCYGVEYSNLEYLPKKLNGKFLNHLEKGI